MKGNQEARSKDKFRNIFTFPCLGKKRCLDLDITSDDERGAAIYNLILKCVILAGIAVVGYAAMTYWDRIHMFRHELAGITFISIVWQAFLIFAFINIAALIWRAVLVFKYRPAPACPDEKLPTCSVVVPAYNEGKLVLSTLQSLAASDYPEEKLQLIAVDDGSVDDTWQWMCKAKEELGDRLTIIKQPENRGKRHALYAGFGMSKGEVLVTVDSDSVVVDDTLRNLVSSFVHNDRVGAVAGNVRVLNRKSGPIPRMLDVIFVFSFDFIRASQSMVNTVMCTPGALSAYRHSVVKTVVEEWLQQKFCGRAANIGEDRAMTNLILREGYYVHFQQNAVVYTDAPTRFVTLCKMYLRWDRSNIRETLVMCRFAFRRFREGGMLGARINLLLSLLSLVKSQIFLLFTVGLLCWHPFEMSLNILVGTLSVSTISAGLYMWKYRSSDSLWAYAYTVFWFVCLSWIMPYALMTPHKSGWLTRQIKPAKAPAKSPAKAPALGSYTGELELNLQMLTPNNR